MCEHLDAILEGLPGEYGPVIESKFEPLPIGEVEALLLVHEARMKKFQKRFADSPLINVAQGYNSSSNNFSSQINPIILEIVVTSIVAMATVVEAVILTMAVATVAEAMALAVLEVVVGAVEVVVVMQISSAKFASNLVTQQRCVIFVMILIFSQTHLSR